MQINPRCTRADGQAIHLGDDSLAGRSNALCTAQDQIRCLHEVVRTDQNRIATQQRGMTRADNLSGEDNIAAGIDHQIPRATIQHTVATQAKLSTGLNQQRTVRCAEGVAGIQSDRSTRP